jgi:hypothetical protein
MAGILLYLLPMLLTKKFHPRGLALAAGESFLCADGLQ